MQERDEVEADEARRPLGHEGIHAAHERQDVENEAAQKENHIYLVLFHYGPTGNNENENAQPGQYRLHGESPGGFG